MWCSIILFSDATTVSSTLHTRIIHTKNYSVSFLFYCIAYLISFFLFVPLNSEQKTRNRLTDRNSNRKTYTIYFSIPPYPASAFMSTAVYWLQGFKPFFPSFSASRNARLFFCDGAFIIITIWYYILIINNDHMNHDYYDHYHLSLRYINFFLFLFTVNYFM